MTAKTMTTPAPFESDCEYLDLEFAYLSMRARRLGTEIRLSEDHRDHPPWNASAIGAQETVWAVEQRRCLDLCRDEERKLNEEIDARLTAHRADRDRFTLALDLVTADHGLDGTDRTVLLLAVCAAICPKVTRRILIDLDVGFGGRLTVESCIAMTEPSGVGAWLEARRHFSPGTSLIKAGLITVAYPSREYTPGDLLEGNVEITAAGLAAVVGDQSMIDHEGEDHDA